MACRDIHEVRHLGVLMGYCDHQMHRLMTKKLRQYDVSPMQCRTLTYLQEAEGQVNQRMLEQYLMVKPSTASGIVGRLEEKGLVRRQTGVTETRWQYAQVLAIAEQVNQQAAQGFSPEERDTLRQLLLRLADNLSETQEDTE